jgi:hypothetical protein
MPPSRLYIAAVLHLLAKRYNRPEIAEETGFTPSTVRNYIERIEDLAKLDQKGLRDWWADGGEDGYVAWLAERLERGTG